ncbi:uncharacterized protein LOC119580677 [Penaeus monodon]|uniref:uncharacterized protein LOC119580677 n=1 Tax=Penaeus monodon TaxID=6687 RepID=UPI0018A765E6|nr:uncharacterized protein LOC119580677 [Penaeus monodon]
MPSVTISKLEHGVQLAGRCIQPTATPWNGRLTSSLSWTPMSIALLTTSLYTETLAQWYVQLHRKLTIVRRGVEKFSNERKLTDNSPIHTSRTVQDWFREHPDIVLQSHPPRSPDLNPIENMWAAMSKYMHQDHTRNRVAVVNNASQTWERL